jgi:hypothetical protein
MASKPYILLMSEQVLGERLKADEATTTIALQHSFNTFSLDSMSDVVKHARAMIRTGAIYLVPGDHMMEAIRHLPPISELPPLPFPRIIVEGTDNETDKPIVLFLSGEKAGKDGLGIKLATILEVRQGTEWNVVLVLSMKGGQEYFPFGLIHEDKGLTTTLSKGFLDFYGDDPCKLHNMSDLQLSSIYLSGFVINLVHLITARNAPKERVELHRKQRQNFRRRYFIEAPSVYRIKLDQAGDREGFGGWHYKVRFLVCGHWRHYKSGRRVWVHAYIKGPAGAPWKGRPVHETGEENEEG